MATIQSALDLFITADDSSVEGVIVNGRGIYGESDLMSSLGDGIYSQYTDASATLGSKYFLIPDFFEETSLQMLSEDYNTIIQEADIVLSQIRTSEDELYMQEMEELKNEFSITTH